MMGAMYILGVLGGLFLLVFFVLPLLAKKDFGVSYREYLAIIFRW